MYASQSNQKPVTSNQTNNSGNWKLVTGFSIPSEYGTIQESYRGTSAKTIIYLQDAHDSLEAQENIAKIIEHLVARHGVKTVFEEGYEGPVPTEEYFGFIKDPQQKKKISHFLMDKLRLGGAEYAHINRRRDFKLIGADNIKLHLENIKGYRKSSHFKQEIEEDLVLMQKEIDKLANRYFSKELKEWMKVKERFDRHELGALDYRERVMSLRGGPSVGRRNDVKAFFDEISHLEEDLTQKLLKSTRDQKIFQVHQQISLLKRLTAVQLTSQEYENLSHILYDMRTQKVADFIARASGKSIVLSRMWEEEIKHAIRFYEIARERDEAVKKTLQAYSVERIADRKTTDPNDSLYATRYPLNASILVFGGFHRERILQTLKDLGYSYVVVSPKIKELSPRHELQYKHLMTKGHYDFEPASIVSLAAPAGRVFEVVAKSEIRNYLDSLPMDPEFGLGHSEKKRAEVRARSELRNHPDEDAAKLNRREFLNRITAAMAAAGIHPPPQLFSVLGTSLHSPLSLKDESPNEFVESLLANHPFHGVDENVLRAIFRRFHPLPHFFSSPFQAKDNIYKGYPYDRLYTKVSRTDTGYTTIHRELSHSITEEDIRLLEDRTLKTERQGPDLGEMQKETEEAWVALQGKIDSQQYISNWIQGDENFRQILKKYSEENKPWFDWIKKEAAQLKSVSELEPELSDRIIRWTLEQKYQALLNNAAVLTDQFNKSLQRLKDGHAKFRKIIAMRKTLAERRVKKEARQKKDGSDQHDLSLQRWLDDGGARARSEMREDYMVLDPALLEERVQKIQERNRNQLHSASRQQIKAVYSLMTNNPTHPLVRAQAASVISAYEGIATGYIKKGKLEYVSNAVHSAREIFELFISEPAVRTMSGNILRAYVNLASAYIKEGNLTAASSTLQEAEKFMEPFASDVSVRALIKYVISSYTNMAVKHLKEGELESANKAAQTAQRIFDAFESEPSVRAEAKFIVTTYNNLAAAFIKKGSPTVASQLLVRSHKIFETFISDPPVKTEAQYLIKSYTNLAAGFIKKDDLAAARQAIQSAHEILEDFVSDPSVQASIPFMIGAYHNLASALVKKADGEIVYQEDLDVAGQALQSAYQIFEAFLSEPSVKAEAVDLYLTHNKLALVLVKKEYYEAANQALQSAHHILESFKSEPSVRDKASFSMVVYHHLASAWIKKENFQAANQAIQRAHDILNDFASEPAVRGEAPYVISAYTSLASVLIKKGDLEFAHQAAQAAHQILDAFASASSVRDQTPFIIGIYNRLKTAYLRLRPPDLEKAEQIGKAIDKIKQITDAFGRSEARAKQARGRQPGELAVKMVVAINYYEHSSDRRHQNSQEDNSSARAKFDLDDQSIRREIEERSKAGEVTYLSEQLKALEQILAQAHQDNESPFRIEQFEIYQALLQDGLAQIPTPGSKASDETRSEVRGDLPRREFLRKTGGGLFALSSGLGNLMPEQPVDSFFVAQIVSQLAKKFPYDPAFLKSIVQFADYTMFPDWSIHATSPKGSSPLEKWEASNRERFYANWVSRSPEASYLVILKKLKDKGYFGNLAAKAIDAKLPFRLREIALYRYYFRRTLTPKDIEKFGDEYLLGVLGILRSMNENKPSNSPRSEARGRAIDLGRFFSGLDLLTLGNPKTHQREVTEPFSRRYFLKALDLLGRETHRDKFFRALGKIQMRGLEFIKKLRGVVSVPKLRGFLMGTELRNLGFLFLGFFHRLSVLLIESFPASQDERMVFARLFRVQDFQGRIPFQDYLYIQTMSILNSLTARGLEAARSEARVEGGWPDTASVPSRQTRAERRGAGKYGKIMNLAPEQINNMGQLVQSAIGSRRLEVGRKGMGGSGTAGRRKNSNANVSLGGVRSSRLFPLQLISPQSPSTQTQSSLTPFRRPSLPFGEISAAETNNSTMPNIDATFHKRGISFEAQKLSKQPPNEISEYRNNEADILSRRDSAIRKSLNEGQKSVKQNSYKNYDYIKNTHFASQRFERNQVRAEARSLSWRTGDRFESGELIRSTDGGALDIAQQFFENQKPYYLKVVPIGRKGIVKQGWVFAFALDNNQDPTLYLYPAIEIEKDGKVLVEILEAPAGETHRSIEIKMGPVGHSLSRTRFSVWFNEFLFSVYPTPNFKVSVYSLSRSEARGRGRMKGKKHLKLIKLVRDYSVYPARPETEGSKSKKSQKPRDRDREGTPKVSHFHGFRGNRSEVREGEKMSDSFKGRLLKVLTGSAFAGIAVFVLYSAGFLDGYLSVKGSIPPHSLFYGPAAFLDAVTGVLVWGISDAIGQYLNQGRPLRKKQSLFVASAGIFQGVGTHVLLNIPDFLPTVGWDFGQKLLRTGIVLIGGTLITLVFARATSLARRLLKVEGYAEGKEVRKTLDVLLTKLIAAPLKTFVVINVLPISIRVITEQTWDYFMTIWSSYLMNRKDALFVKRLPARFVKFLTREKPGDRQSKPRSELRGYLNLAVIRKAREKIASVLDELTETGDPDSSGELGRQLSMTIEEIDAKHSKKAGAILSDIRVLEKNEKGGALDGLLINSLDQARMSLWHAEEPHPNVGIFSIDDAEIDEELSFKINLQEDLDNHSLFLYVNDIRMAELSGPPTHPGQQDITARETSVDGLNLPRFFLHLLKAVEILRPLDGSVDFPLEVRLRYEKDSVKVYINDSETPYRIFSHPTRVSWRQGERLKKPYARALMTLAAAAWKIDPTLRLSISGLPGKSDREFIHTPPSVFLARSEIRQEFRIMNDMRPAGWYVREKLESLKGTVTVFANKNTIQSLTPKQFKEDFKKMAHRHKLRFVFYGSARLDPEKQKRIEKLQQDLGANRIVITDDGAGSVFRLFGRRKSIHINKRGVHSDEDFMKWIPRKENFIFFEYLQDEIGVVPTALLYTFPNSKSRARKTFNLSLVGERIRTEVLSYLASLVLGRSA